jgi:tRNA(Ile2) C34 agmatinyltransferase TiaS
MGSTRDQVKAMLYELVGKGLYSGYINWEKGVLYSAEASNLTELSQCKNCGGEIRLSGKGVVSCPYCGTEYFLT